MQYAIPTTDSGFKQMLAIDLEEGTPKIALSFLNSFIPQFQKNPITKIRNMPVATPPLKRFKGERQSFMDFHVMSDAGKHFIVEMQSKRHVMFDERALFYACSTYSHQLTGDVLKGEGWYSELKPVISLQILDYDSQKVRGITTHVADHLVQRVHDHPLKEGEYAKHYILTDEISGQKIDHLQLIQIELPRARATHSFPPVGDCNERDWWLTFLCHSTLFTAEGVRDLQIPEAIRLALDRLLLDKWTPAMKTEYASDLINRELYATVLAAERAEGEQIGMAKGIETGTAAGTAAGMATGIETGTAAGMARGIETGMVKAAKCLIENGQIRKDVITSLNLSEDQIRMLDELLAAQ
jgi:hypothetical protein